MLLTDAETGIGISITLWETEEGGFFDEQVKKFADLLLDSPVREYYDLGVMV